MCINFDGIEEIFSKREYEMEFLWQRSRWAASEERSIFASNHIYASDAKIGTHASEASTLKRSNLRLRLPSTGAFRAAEQQAAGSNLRLLQPARPPPYAVNYFWAFLLLIWLELRRNCMMNTDWFMYACLFVPTACSFVRSNLDIWK